MFMSFSMLPSLPLRIHTNMRAVLRLHCTGRKDRPEWVFRSIKKTPINSLRNDSFRINFTLVIMWQPVWTRSCTKLIRMSCKRPIKVFITRESRISPVWILELSVALKQKPAFNCFAAAETSISIQRKQKSLYMVNIHLCRYQLLRD